MQAGAALCPEQGARAVYQRWKCSCSAAAPQGNSVSHTSQECVSGVKHSSRTDCSRTDMPWKGPGQRMQQASQKSGGS